MLNALVNYFLWVLSSYYWRTLVLRWQIKRMIKDLELSLSFALDEDVVPLQTLQAKLQQLIDKELSDVTRRARAMAISIPELSVDAEDESLVDAELLEIVLKRFRLKFRSLIDDRNRLLGAI